MYSRAFVREHDKTTQGGTVMAPFNTIAGYGSTISFDGDPVYCPACKSTGVTKCIPPFHPWTGPDGRQVNLDGDLCLCKCFPPPKLLASDLSMAMNFDKGEVSQMADSEGWLKQKGLLDKTEFHDQQFVLRDANGDPMAGMACSIKFKSTGDVIHVITDSNGMTGRIRRADDGPDEIEVLWGHQ